MLYKNKSLAVYHETWSGYKMDLVAAFKQSLNVLLLAQKWFKTAGKQTNKQTIKKIPQIHVYVLCGLRQLSWYGQIASFSGGADGKYLFPYVSDFIWNDPSVLKPMFLTFCTSACRKHTYMETHESLLLWSSWDLTLLLLHSNVFLSKY